ncbi:unnamed protein product [Closterium sp. Naga37s-1]|nr:unnamed protein product [Closterium sp. Naga37s-1]
MQSKQHGLGTPSADAYIPAESAPAEEPEEVRILRAEVQLLKGGLARAREREAAALHQLQEVAAAANAKLAAANAEVASVRAELSAANARANAVRREKDAAMMAADRRIDALQRELSVLMEEREEAAEVAVAGRESLDRAEEYLKALDIAKVEVKKLRLERDILMEKNRLLEEEKNKRLVDTLRRTYGLAPDAEICMEADPGTFDEARLRAWVEGSGVTRLSVGCQAFDETLLKACGRSHSLADVYDAVDAVKRVGLENWSLDLISGLPCQTLDSWHHSLSEVIRLGPSHVSVYDLQVEQGTAFGRWYSPGRSPLPADDLSADMYREASRQLRAVGYVHYEVSNYAKPGFQSRHNRTYWTNFPYLGFGLGAASYVARKRFVRPRTWDGYGEWVGKYEASNGVIDWPEDSREEELLDTVMLGLRLGEGLGMPELAGRFGGEAAVAVGKALLKFVEAGLVEIVQVLSDGRMEVVGREKKYLRALEQQWDVMAAREKGGVGIVGDGVKGGVVEGPTARRGSEGGEGAGGRQHVRWPDLRMRLTDPEGFLVSNDVISSVFEAVG